MARYVIWDKETPVITPGIDLVISGESAVNGAFCNEYTSFVAIYKGQGCDFTGCETKQDHLDKIEEFEEANKQAGQDYVSPEERMAAAQEGQLLVMMEQLPEE